MAIWLQVPELTASHVFSFWEGIPVEARCALGRLVAASPAVQVSATQSVTAPAVLLRASSDHPEQL